MRKERNNIEAIIALAFYMLAMLVIGILQVHGADRCRDYTTDVRIQAFKYFGTDFPWHYNLAQLKTESNCRADITAFDGGQGLAQFMPATERDIERVSGPLDMYNPEHAIRAQAWYMAKLHRQNWDGRLFLTYQAYNGGWTNLKKEFERAGVIDWAIMRECCKRKVIGLKNGRYLNLCDVNYDYSQKIYRYGQQYKISSDRRAYW